MRGVSISRLEFVLRIPLDSIPAHGRIVDVGLADEWALAAVAAAIESSPSTMGGQVEVAPLRQQRVKVGVDVHLSANTSCDRCAEPMILDLHAAHELHYKPLPDDVDDDAELEESDLDVGWYSDRSLDLGAVLQEAVTLSVPVRITCKDAEACETRTEALLANQRATSDVGHPGFAALRTINE